MKSEIVELYVWGIFGVCFIVDFVWIELTCRDSWFRCWLWCKRHGLKHKSRWCPIAGGVIFWWGEDEAGNEYVPGSGNKPRLVSMRAANADEEGGAA